MLMSTVSTAAYAQNADIVMRRPLPRDVSGVTPGPTPTPQPVVTPTPTTPTPQPTPTPVGTEETTAFGWNINCMPPEYATCESLVLDQNGHVSTTPVDSALCTPTQSDAKNAIVNAIHYYPPGQHDFDAICNNPPVDPYRPPENLSGYGYDIDCINSTAYCYKMTVNRSDADGWGTSMEDEDFASCGLAQTPEAIDMVTRRNYMPGGAGLTMAKALEFCANPPSNFLYGYSADCQDNKISSEYTCVGMDPSGQMGYGFPIEKCDSFSPTPLQKAQMAGMGAYATREEAAASISSWCTGGEEPVEMPNPNDGMSSNPDHVQEGSPPTGTVFDPQWEAGQWGGDAQCGTSGTLTRTVTCTAQPACVPRDGGDLCNENDYPARVAVPSSMCSSLPMPSTTYTGTQAGCGYTVSYTYGQWTNWNSNADIGCSTDSHRLRTPVCRNSGGQTVPLEYCKLGLDAGGTEKDISNEEWGNYESCVYVAEPRRGTIACDGSSAYRPVTGMSCTRSDGATASIDKCDVNPGIQFPYREPAGSCSETYDLVQRGSAASSCTSSDPMAGGYTYTMLYQGDFPSYAHAQQAAQTLCSGMHATCCQLEFKTSDWSGVGGRPYAIKGSVEPSAIHSYNNWWDYEQSGMEMHSALPKWTPNYDN